MSDTRRDELREKIRDIATGHGMRGRIPESLEKELNEYDRLINGEVLAVLERLEARSLPALYVADEESKKLYSETSVPSVPLSALEQEKQNYAKQ